MQDGVSVARLVTDTTDRFVRLRAELGVSTFGLNAILLGPGERGRIHAHRRQEEVYLVLEGRLVLSVEGEDQTLERYDAVRVAPEVRRQLTNPGPERLVLLALGGAEPHDGRDGLAWESWEEAGPGRPPAEVPLPPALPA